VIYSKNHRAWQAIEDRIDRNVKPMLWKEFLLECLRQRGLADSRTASDDDEFSLHGNEPTPGRSGQRRLVLVQANARSNRRGPGNLCEAHGSRARSGGLRC